MVVPLLSAAVATASSPDSAVSPDSRAQIAALSVPFVANDGQADKQVAFLARTFAGTVFVTRDGRLVYSLRGSDAHATPSSAPHPAGWAISESFEGLSAAPIGLGERGNMVSDFVATAGSRPRHSASPTFERVGLGEIAPGITVEVRATGNNVEKLFTLAPGADAEHLRVRIDGATGLALAADGSLSVGTGLGNLTFTAPLAYQEQNGARQTVTAAYRIGATPGLYGFALGAYDRSLPLIIDPLIRSTYSGGNATDTIRAMLVHPGSGEVYVAGSTTSTTFPSIAGPITTNVVGTDMFVARYTAGLNSLQRVTFYGGAGDDSANAIGILPSSGDIYVAGRTTSASGLVGILNSYTGSGTGNGDALLVRFGGALTSVLGATYFGGSLDDTANGLAVDSVAGEIVMVGETRSTILPVGSGGGAQPNSLGQQDAFVARFSAALGLIRTSYFGGAFDDRATAVAIDPITSDVIVAGETHSTNLNGAANGALSTNGGGTGGDGFVARFSSSLSMLQQSTYFGGTGDEKITAVAVHPFNSHIYVTGDTSSTNLRGKLVGQTTKAAGIDAFVARFYPELTGLKAVTYFGNEGNDYSTALAISKVTGEIYVAGYTNSATLPGSGFGVQTANATTPPPTLITDAFVARFDVGLLSPRQVTFDGGTGDDRAYALALSDNQVFIAGDTAFPFPGVAPNSAQQNPGGGSNDGFISTLTTDLTAQNSTPAPFAFVPVVNALPLTIQTSAPTQVTSSGSATAYVDGQPGSTWCASSGPNCSSCDLTGGMFVQGAVTVISAVPYYVCVRHLSSAAPNVITESTLHVGAMAGIFRVGTGIVRGLGCSLDADGNGTVDALTDGLLILRAMLGLTGTAVTSGAVGSSPTRATWSDISGYLNANCATNFAP